MDYIILRFVQIISAITGVYVGGWLMFIKPILDAASAFDAGMLTGTMIALTILKCIFAGFVGKMIYAIPILITAVIIEIFD